MWIGLFLVVLGALYLLRNFGFFYGDIWNWAWPILLICIGVSFIIKPGFRCFSHTKKREITSQ